MGDQPAVAIAVAAHGQPPQISPESPIGEIFRYRVSDRRAIP